MNFIQINEKYAIESDSNQWFYSRFVKATETKDAYWRPVGGYHRHLKGTATSLGNRLLREADNTSLAELYDTSREIAGMLNASIDIKIEA